MVTIAKVFSTIRKLERIGINSRRKRCFWYPLLFQDDLYGIAFNRFTSESNYRKRKFINFGNEFNFLLLKRLTKESRRSKISWIVSDESIDKKFRAIQEITIIIFDIISSIESDLVKRVNRWNGYQSIHSVFPFMEDRIRYSKICLGVTIPHASHPEILIRIFRRRIRDVSLLHLLRVLLHRDRSIIVSDPHTISHPRKNQFHRLLWNSYIHEFESSLIYVWERIYRFRSAPFWFFLDRTNFVRKMGCTSKHSDSVIVENIAGKNYSIHYVRYRNNLTTTVDGSIESLIRNWKSFLILFWAKYYHSWLEPCKASVKNLYRNSLFFLGYILRIRSRFSLIKIQLANHLINTNLVTKEFCGTIPTVPLTGLLARENFCDATGRPTCRLSWTTLADSEILERFDQVTKNISCYYSGCLGRKGLYQLQYILRFSCAKTLACKHKGTIRTVWKKYGSNFVANSASSQEVDPPIPWRIKPHGKFWYFGILQINYLVNLLQKLENVRDLKG